jgi:hypothetical protein
MELNSVYHMHCIAGIVINFDLLFIWVGIYLYLVTANKILTNLKQCSGLAILFDKPYTSHELPPLASSYTLFPTTC